jgi:hypothetical protein
MRGLPWIVHGLARALQPLIALAPEVAAQTPVYLAQAAGARGTNGRFYGPRLEPRPVPTPAQPPERRIALWMASKELVRRYLPEIAPVDDRLRVSRARA